MRLDFFLLADGANFSEGKLNVHGGAITRMNATGFPFVLPRIFGVARLLFEEGEGREETVDIAIGWTDGEGRELTPRLGGTLTAGQDHRQVVPLEGEERSFVVVAEMGGISFDAPGPVFVELVMNGEVVSRRPLIVVDVGEMEQRPASTPMRYTKTEGGQVLVEGTIVNRASSSESAPTTVMVFPEGYRPSKRVDFEVKSETGTTTVSVLPDGQLLADASVGWIDLEGVRFDSA
jgi:hypothetical protein